MTNVKIKIAGEVFPGVLLEEKAPKTCELFKKMLPVKEKVIHVRWSGEGIWIPYGDMAPDLDYENNTCYPAPGEFIFYPGSHGAVSETEILIAYGRVNFACMAGHISGNHFLTITEGLDRLYAIGRKVLYEGAQDIEVELCD